MWHPNNLEKIALTDTHLHFSNSLIIHKAKTKENHKHDGFGNVIKHLHKLAKLSPSFSPEVGICLRSCITLALVFDHVSKHVKLLLKNLAAPHFSTLETLVIHNYMSPFSSVLFLLLITKSPLLY